MAVDVTRPAARATTASGTSRTPLGTRLLLGVVVALYLAAFHISYVTSIAPRWGYSGLTYLPAGDGSLLFAFVAAWVPALVLPIGATRPSDVILWILYTVAYVPAVIVPYYVLGSGWDILPLTATLFSAVALLLLAQRHTAGRIDPPVRLSGTAYGWAAFGIALAFTAYVASVFGVTLTLPNLASVYDVRFAYVDTLAENGRLVAYAVEWSGLALGPLLLAFGIASRRIHLAIVGIAVMLLIYASTGYKSILFLAPVLAGLMIALRLRPRHFGLLVPTALTLLITVALLLDSLLGSILPSSLAVRRLLDVPGQLTAYYYEFFTTHPTYALSHGILHGLVPQPYPVSPPAMIAWVHHFGGSPNANLWADGMANFGLAGALAATLVAIVVLKVLDAVGRDRPLPVTGAVLGAASLSLANSGILTALVTHGLAFAGVLVLFMPLALPEEAAPTAAGQRSVPRRARTGAPRVVQPPANRLAGGSG